MSLIPPRPKRARPDFALPIINIVFLLLLFYLATGSLIKPAELETNAPLTETLPLELLPRPLLLAAADGSLLLDGVPVAVADLSETARRATASGGPLNVLADRAMPGRDFLGLLARIDAAGIPVRIVSLHARTDAAGTRP